MKRGWMKHASLKKETFTEREAWIWMIEAAAFERCVINIMNKPYQLEIGQFSHSIRFMADQWNWPRTRVENFFKKLIIWDMIETDATHRQVIVTICNYSKYQRPENNKKTEMLLKMGQQKDKVGTNNKELNTFKEFKINIKPFDLPDWLPSDVWSAYIEHKGKNFSKKAQLIALKKLSNWKDEGYDPIEIIETTIMNGWKGLFKPNIDHSSGIFNKKINYQQTLKEAEDRVLLMNTHD